jgi:hypothetical protein
LADHFGSGQCPADQLAPCLRAGPAVK